MLVIAFSPLCWAAAPCSACEDETPATAADRLVELGLDQSEHDLLLAWDEVSRDGTKTLVHGARIRRKQDGATFDLYTDVQGRTLDDSELEALAMVPKSLTSLPAQRPTEPGLDAPRPVAGAAVAMGAYTGPDRDPDLTLEALDHTALFAEDASSPDKGAVRVGVFREFPDWVVVDGDRSTHGVWEILPDGSHVWTLIIHSPGAVGQRLHFIEANLPGGAQLSIGRASCRERVYGLV